MTSLKRFPEVNWAKLVPPKRTLEGLGCENRLPVVCGAEGVKKRLDLASILLCRGSGGTVKVEAGSLAAIFSCSLAGAAAEEEKMLVKSPMPCDCEKRSNLKGFLG